MEELPVITNAGNGNSAGMHDTEPERIISEIRRRRAGVVGLQFPEGLKKSGFEIARMIEKETGAKVFISANPCFGACDLDERLIGFCDVLFHFGHSQLEKTSLEEKVCFIETRSGADIEKAVRASTSLLKGPGVGLVTTVQHAHMLPEAARLLSEAGFSPVIGKGDNRVVYPGQVLGCNFSSARDASGDCDEFLFIGSGEFHPIGISLSTGRRVICADPYMSTAREITPRRYLMKRSAVLGNARDAQTFGILISTKNGQCRMKLADALKEKAEAHGKEAFLIAADLVTPDQLLSFRADAFINTACPRLAVDDSGRFPAPVLTPQEFEIIVGEREWEDLVMDEIIEGGRE